MKGAMKRPSAMWAYNIIDLNAVLGKDAGCDKLRSLAHRCLGVGTVWVCLCERVR